MTGYVIRRILWIIPVLWAVATITFFLMHAVPGGPFTQDKQLPDAIIQNLNHRYHLDQPLWQQYVSYLWDISHGDLGLSFRGDRDVSYLIGHGFFVTAQLGVLAFFVAMTWGLFLGVVSALNRNGPLDYLGVLFATVGASVPNFIAGTSPERNFLRIVSRQIFQRRASSSGVKCRVVSPFVLLASIVFMRAVSRAVV